MISGDVALTTSQYLTPKIIKPHSGEPRPRSGHRMVADEANLYSVGGYIHMSDDSLVVKAEVWKFNLISKTWTQLKLSGDFPDLTASHDIAMVGKDILVHGGTGTDFGFNIDNELHVIQLDYLACLTVPTKPKNDDKYNLPLATYGHVDLESAIQYYRHHPSIPAPSQTLTYVNLDGCSYAVKIGGTDGHHYTNRVSRLDLHRGEWERLADEKTTGAPVPRYRHETVAYKDNLFIIGGGNDTKFGFELHYIPVFNLVTNHWSNVKLTGAQIFPENGQIRCQSCSIIGSIVYYLGGFMQNEVFSRDIYQINLDSMVCSKIGAWSDSSYFHAATIVPRSGGLYTFGGVQCIQQQRRTNTIHLLQLPVPLPLAELAWQRLLNHSLSTQQACVPLHQPTRKRLLSFSSGHSAFTPVGEQQVSYTTLRLHLFRMGVPDRFLDRFPSDSVSAA